MKPRTMSDTQRLIEAWTSDQKQPPQPFECMTPADMMSWLTRQAGEHPNGLIGQLADNVKCNFLMEQVLDARTTGQMTDTEFEGILLRLRTASGRDQLNADYLAAFEASRIAEGAIKKASLNQTPRAPHFLSTNDELLSFRSAKPRGGGPLLHEFSARRDVAENFDGRLPPQGIYEFSWGFVRESYGVWDFYVADVWRKDTEAYFDRFLTAWKNDAEPVLERAMRESGDRFYVSFDDGISNYSCLSLGCVSQGPHAQHLAREWVATKFLPTIWPVMVAEVLDPKFQFAQDWYCS